MRVPTISKDFAISQWNQNVNRLDLLPVKGQIDYIGPEDEPKLNELELEDLLEQLEQIRLRYEDQYPEKLPKNVGGRVESELVGPIHRTLSAIATPGQLSQPGFWRWFSNVAYRGRFWDFIDWRFGSGEDRKQVNWAITSTRNLKESLLFRCWVRGHKLYTQDAPDPYHYAKKGTGDFWRSHILRQDFGKDRTFIEAFLDFNFAPDGTRRISDTKLRQKLIPGVRAWTSMASFSHLSYEECTYILSHIWENEERR